MKIIGRCIACEIQITPQSQSHKVVLARGETLWCNTCNGTYKEPSKKNWVLDSMARRRKVGKIKLDRGCEWEGGCEYTKGNFVDHRQLDLDHIDPSIKIEHVSTMLIKIKKYPWEIVEAEIAKCRVLCKMHHAIVPTSTRKRAHLIAE